MSKRGFGGDAGGGKRDGQFVFVKQTPKFLQAMMGGMPPSESEVEKKKAAIKTSDDEDGDVKDDYVFAEDAKDIASLVADGKTSIADLQAKLKADAEKGISLPSKKVAADSKAKEEEEEEEEDEDDDAPEVIGADGKPVIRFRKPKKKAKKTNEIATVGAPAARKPAAATTASKPATQKPAAAATANKTLLSFEEDEA